MTFRFDHAIIAVQDLQRAKEDYTDMGFTVLDGGEHADGATHNALICFEDGTYLELLALTGRPSNSPKVASYADWLAKGGGLIGYALLSDDLEADVKALRANGIKVGDIQTGGRMTMDGVELKWKSASLDGTISPFFIEDVTPRENRVPNDVDAITHPNQISGVVEVGLLVGDMPKMTDFYSAIVDGSGEKFEKDIIFNMNGTTLTLSPPKSKIHRQHIEQRGNTPYELVLRTGNYVWACDADMTESHGANLRLLTDVYP